MSDFDSEDEEEMELRRQLEELENKKVELSEEDLMLEKLRKEHENIKFWGPVLLLYPLGPVCVATTTVVFGGVIVNVASLECNAKIDIFLEGAIWLSYLLLMFYSWCWLSPRPIKSLRSLKIFYAIYGVLCFGWWGIFGTLEGSRATNTGLGSCLEQSPALYVMTAYQIAIFWILFSFFLCWSCRGIGTILLNRQKVASLKARQKQMELEKQMEAEARREAEEEERRQAEEDEEERIRLEKEERERLYASSDEEGGGGSGGEGGHASADDSPQDKANDDVSDDDDDDSDEADEDNDDENESDDSD